MTSTATIDGERVQISNGDRENAKAWFVYSKTDSADASMALKETPMEYSGLDNSIDLVAECLMKHDGKFCAILGFSQGATFCHILSILSNTAKQNNDANSKMRSLFANIRCAIMLSGFSSMHNGSLANCHDANAESNKLDVKSLHIFGERDTSVPKMYGEKLANRFANPELYDHGKGHVIPHNIALCDRVIKFLDSCSAQWAKEFSTDYKTV